MFAEKCKALRKERSLSQEQLAEICELLLPRRNKMEILYEDAELYDVIYNNQRNNQIKYIWEQINLSNYSIKTIHDCSIRTGQLTIPLSMLGYEVLARIC